MKDKKDAQTGIDMPEIKMLMENYRKEEVALYYNYKKSTEITEKCKILENLYNKTKHRQIFEIEAKYSMGYSDLYVQLVSEIPRENDKIIEGMAAKTLKENLETQLATLGSIYRDPKDRESQAIEEWLVNLVNESEPVDTQPVKRKKEMTPEERASNGYNLESAHKAQENRRQYYKITTHWKPNGEEVDQTQDYIAKTRFTM